MGLRDEAATDLAEIYADKTDGLGWDCTVTAPDGTSAPVTGRSNDIGQLMDMETGAIVSGRSVSASFTISSLVTAGFSSIPVGIADGTGKPWRVDFQDINGNSHTFKVQSSNPDRTLGVVTCILEVYQP